MVYAYFFIKCVVRLSENSVRFVKSYGNCLPDGPNSVRFLSEIYISQCEIWHVCNFYYYAAHLRKTLVAALITF